VIDSLNGNELYSDGIWCYVGNQEKIDFIFMGFLVVWVVKKDKLIKIVHNHYKS